MPLPPLFRAAGSAALLLLLLAVHQPGAARTLPCADGLQLYLDSAHQAVTLQLPSTAPRSGLRLSMLDATGHIVFRRPLNVTTGPLVSLPIGGYSAGTYLLIVEGPNGYNIAQRLVLK